MVSRAWRAEAPLVRSVTYLLRSRTWTRSATGCCSNASLIPSASTRRISTSTSRTTAARTSSNTCEKYGRDAVAQIITFGTMGAKSVVRDVGRVMGLNYSECDRLAKMIPAELKMSRGEGAQNRRTPKQAHETGRDDTRTD